VWYVSYTLTWIHPDLPETYANGRCCKVVKRTACFSAAIYCDKQFWKQFTIFATVLIKVLCCSCDVFLFTYPYAKIEYVSVCTYPSKKQNRPTYATHPWALPLICRPMVHYSALESSDFTNNVNEPRFKCSFLLASYKLRTVLVFFPNKDPFIHSRTNRTLLWRNSLYSV